MSKMAEQEAKLPEDLSSFVISHVESATQYLDDALQLLTHNGQKPIETDSSSSEAAQWLKQAHELFSRVHQVARDHAYRLPPHTHAFQIALLGLQLTSRATALHQGETSRAHLLSSACRTSASTLRSFVQADETAQRISPTVSASQTLLRWAQLLPLD